MADPDPRGVPALAAFLAQRADRFDCADLPTAIATTDLNAFQRGVRYLQIAVALTWKVTGVSWPGLDALAGVLFAAVAAATYGILRLSLSRGFALAALLASVTATSNFMLVPHLRDYAKGPFLLAVIFILGLFVRESTGRGAALALAALVGTVAGIGLGVRNDLAIALPPCVLTIVLLAPPSLGAGGRCVALTLFAAAFLAMAFPVLRDYAKGGNNGHVVMLGLTAPFDSPLRIEPSVYRFGGRYLDASAYTTISASAIRSEGMTHMIDGASVEYERAATLHLGRIATTFPGDMVTRLMAAVRAVPKYFLDSSLYPPVQLRSEFLRSLYPLRARVLWRLGQGAFLAIGLATLIVSAVNSRAAWLVVTVVVGFAGAAAIQFDERHFGYLMFLPWWAYAFLAQTALRHERVVRSVETAQLRRAVVFGAALVCVSVGAIQITRALQQRRVSSLLARYAEARQMPLPVVQASVAGGRTLFAVPEWSAPMPSGGRPIETRFLAVTLRDAQCGSDGVTVTVRYDGRRPPSDLSEVVRVRPPLGTSVPTTLFVVAYDWADDSIRFRGIEVPADRASCVARIGRVDGLEHEPLLLTTTLGANWREEHLYQRLQ